MCFGVGLGVGGTLCLIGGALGSCFFSGFGFFGFFGSFGVAPWAASAAAFFGCLAWTLGRCAPPLSISGLKMTDMTLQATNT